MKFLNRNKQTRQPLVARQVLAGLVNPQWYKALYPDIASAGVNPVDHYVKAGFREDRSPNPFFVPSDYKMRFPDVAGFDGSCIEHYMQFGAVEQRSPTPFIDPHTYLENYGADIKGTLLEDLMSAEDRRLAIPFFDLDWYQNQSGASGASHMASLLDFLIEGLADGRTPHALVDLPTVKGMPSFSHAFHFFLSLFHQTASRGFLPASQFVDARFVNQSEVEFSCHPIIHYLNLPVAQRDELKLHPLFDAPYYRNRYHLADSIDALEHFVVEGEAAGYLPNKYLETSQYKQRYGHTFIEGESVLAHYMRLGHELWLEPGQEFCQRFYARRHPDAADSRLPLLADFLSGSGRPRLTRPQPPFFDDIHQLTDEELVEEILRLDGLMASEQLPNETDIVVPVYENRRLTLRCLLGCFRARGKNGFTLYVADDRSPDGTGDWLERKLGKVHNIKIVQNESNLGFLQSCNHCASLGSGSYIHFLNNDTYPLPGWLDDLIDTLCDDKSVGLTGSKLIYPNGLLQEAGGIIWSSGDCANFGKFDDPFAPEYNYQRDVDYISAASILVRRTDWEALDGFSKEFFPAYYEDTDFAMRVWKSGKKVRYCPTSTVIHDEGQTQGTDLSSGIKQYQTVNKQKFYDRWWQDIEKFGEAGDLSERVLNRTAKRKILVIDEQLPKPDQDSGSVTAFYHLKILKQLGCHVSFLPRNLSYEGKYAAPLEKLGVEVLKYPYVQSVESFLEERAKDYDLFLLSRVTAGAEFLPLVRRYSPDAKIIFDTVDLHHLRMFREAQAVGDSGVLSDAYTIREKELFAISASDLTLVVSEYERDYLKTEIGPSALEVIPLIFEPSKSVAPFDGRKDFAFVGSFNHRPNIDAVTYLVESIWPEYRKLGGKSDLHIIGSNMPPEIHSLDEESVHPIGFVEDLDTYLSRMVATVAPLRYGAGVKGKVGNSLRLGVPVVGTPMAFEGMGLVPGKQVLEAADACGFAKELLRVENSSSEWRKLSKEGRQFVTENYGLEPIRKRWQNVLGALGR